MSLEKIDDRIKFTNTNYWGSIERIAKIEELQYIRPIVEQLEADKRELKTDINKIMEVLEENYNALNELAGGLPNARFRPVFNKSKQFIDEWKGGNNE